MIDKTVEWAKQNGQHRISKLHGEEEVCIVLEENFGWSATEEQNQTRQQRFDVEARRVRALPGTAHTDSHPPLQKATVIRG